MAMIYFNLNHLNFYILYKTSHICAWLYFKNELEIDSVGDVCVCGEESNLPNKWDKRRQQFEFFHHIS